MTVLIGGGSGFVGTALCSMLKNRGVQYKVISRVQRPNGITWNDVKQKLPSDTEYVINLAGANLADFTKSWTRGYKQEVFDSRIQTTRQLAEAVDKTPEKIKAFIQTSAVGFYPPSETAEYTEDSSGGDNTDVFTGLCKQWEDAGQLKSPNVRRVILRFGVVLGRQGGMVRNVYLPFRLGLGGPVGSGKQWLPWIHVDDLAALFHHVLFAPQAPRGVLNAVAPQVVTSANFATALAGAMRRPALFGTPAWLLKCLVDPDRARLFLTGQKVLPKRTLESGFSFQYPDIESACAALVAAG